MGESSVVRRRRATCASETKLSILRHRPNQLIVSPLSAAVTLAVGLSTFVCAEKNRLESGRSQCMAESSWSHGPLRLLMYSVKFLLPISHT